MGFTDLVGMRAMGRTDLRCAGCGMSWTFRGTQAEGEAELLEHASKCSANAGRVLPAATDEQLVAEWRRRHGLPIGALADRTDAELRAECERRFPSGFGVVHEVTLRESERYRRAAIESDRLNCEAVRERDEWKRRADVLNERLSQNAPRDRMCHSCGVSLCPDEDDRQCTKCRREENGVSAVGRLRTPRPDNSVALLDEDLLCEDA